MLRVKDVLMVYVDAFRAHGHLEQRLCFNRGWGDKGSGVRR